MWKYGLKLLRMLVALLEEPSSIHSAHMEPCNVCNSCARIYDALFWPQWVPDIHMIHRHTSKHHPNTIKVI